MNFDIKKWGTKEWMYAGLGVVGAYVGYRLLKRKSSDYSGADSQIQSGSGATVRGGRRVIPANKPAINQACQSTANYVNSKNTVGNMTAALANQCRSAGGIISVANKGTSRQRQVCMCPRSTGVSGMEDFYGLGRASRGQDKRKRQPQRQQRQPQGNRQQNAHGGGKMFDRPGRAQGQNRPNVDQRRTGTQGRPMALPAPNEGNGRSTQQTAAPQNAYGKLLKESGWQPGQPKPSYRELLAKNAQSPQGAFGAALQQTQNTVTQDVMMQAQEALQQQIAQQQTDSSMAVEAPVAPAEYMVGQ